MNSITIPRNTLVLLVGPAGCGKSSFAAKHFWPTQIVSSDRCRAMICDDAANQAITPLAFDLMHSIIEMRLRLGRLTVADATNLKREDRRPLVRLARRAGFNTAAIVFNLPLEVCLERNQRRRRVVPAEAIALQYELLRETLSTISREGFSYHWVLDEAAASQVAVKIGRGINRRPGLPARS
ncbi:MAG TPA: AAA family ATPase [Blastocatellia bacterium]|nr:AAA family ATPase [Blastocatellia bacterium]